MMNLYTCTTTEKRIYIKKLLLALVAVLMLVGCSAKTAEEPAGTEASETVKLDGLELQFVPSKDADVIIAGTEGLP